MKRHKRIDFNEDDPAYLKLIRISHAIWKAIPNQRPRGGYTSTELRAFYEAVEIMADLRRMRVRELRADRVAESLRLKKRFQGEAGSELPAPKI